MKYALLLALAALVPGQALAMVSFVGGMMIVPHYYDPPAPPPPAPPILEAPPPAPEFATVIDHIATIARAAETITSPPAANGS